MAALMLNGVPVGLLPMASVADVSVKTMRLLAAIVPLTVTDPFRPICNSPVPVRLPAKVIVPPTIDKVPLSTIAALTVASVRIAKILPASTVRVPAVAVPEPISMELDASTKRKGVVERAVPALPAAGAWIVRLPACTDPPLVTARL